MTLSRINHTGAAVLTTITGSITAGSTSCTLASGTGWPTTNFVLKLDAGTASEEKILCATRSGGSVTFTTRGYDGTSATSHTSSATAEHDLAAVVIDDANDHVYTTSRDDHTQYARTDGTRAFSGGVTVTAGGLTVTAGGLTVAAGGAAVTGNSSATGTDSATAQIATLTGTPGRYVGTTNGAPATGTYLTNDFASDPTNGIFWVCTTGGTPGTWSPLRQAGLSNTAYATGGLTITYGAAFANTTDSVSCTLTGTNGQLLIPLVTNGTKTGFNVKWYGGSTNTEYGNGLALAFYWSAVGH